MHKNLKLFLALVSAPLWGEPFLAPNDPFIRHEIRMLGDESNLLGIQNNWPLNLGALSDDDPDGGKPFLGHSLLEEKIKAENRSGWSPITSTLGFSNDQMVARGFGPKPHSDFATNVSLSWMNDRFAAKLSMNALYGMEKDWKGRMDEGLSLDGSYLAARLGNWSATLGQVDRWWGPGWDGSLILSSNARPIPTISIERRMPEPFESKWLSWLGPWSFQSFVGRMEEERHVPNPLLWGMRGDLSPTILDGLELGFFRVIQLGGQGRPQGLSTFVDAFLSQDNYGANTGNNDLSREPGNQLAGLDLRWRPFDAQFAVYGQVVGEDEDKFLPNALMFLYGIEGWMFWQESSLRFFAEYADLTSYWWNGATRTRNLTYGHHIYRDGYRYRGRPVGHWADQDAKILSFGSLFMKKDGISLGGIIRTGDLNEDGAGESSVSNSEVTNYTAFEFYNYTEPADLDISIHSSIGWESIKSKVTRTNESFTAFLSLTRLF